MKLRQQIAQAIGKRLFGIGREDVAVSSAIGISGNRDQRRFINEYTGLVYAIISAIAEDVGKYEPILVKETAKGDQEVSTHPFLELIYNPNPAISKFELFEGTQSFIEMTGESFWYFALGDQTKKPKAIYMLRPDRMKVAVDDNGDIAGYALQKSGGETIPFDLNEILQFRMFNPHSPYRGMGTVEAGLAYIETEESATTFSKNALKNSAAPNGVLQLKGTVAKPAFEKFVQLWREKYEGAENAGKTAIIRDVDAEFTKVGLGLSEIDMKALKDLTVDQVLMMFRVPRSIIGLSTTEGMGRASVETLEYIYAKRVIDPKLERIDAALQRILDRFWPNDGLTVMHKDIVPEDKEFQLASRTAGVDNWLTRNEIREEDGLEPVDGGNDLRAPLTSYPIGENTPASKAEEKKLGKIKIVKTTKVSQARANEQFRQMMMGIQSKFETKTDKKLKVLLEEQRQQIVGRINPKGLKKDFDYLMFDEEEEKQKFDKELYPIMAALYLAVGKEALQFSGADQEKLELSPSVSNNIHIFIKRLAGNFNAETKAKLNATLTEGFQNGESLAKMSKRVTSVYDEAKGYRAERIARTETLRASNAAANEAYRQSGHVTAMKWIAEPDACEFCLAMEALDPVPLSGAFAELNENIEGVDGGTTTIDYDNVEWPPLHPNCRCTIVPVRG